MAFWVRKQLVLNKQIMLGNDIVLCKYGDTEELKDLTTKKVWGVL